MKRTTAAVAAYIPPAKLRRMQEQIQDKSSEEYQKLAWEALKKSLTGIVNKINTSNIRPVCLELFAENLIRGRGLFCQAILRAQSFSPVFTNVYAALAAVVNSKFPNVCELLIHRVVAQFRRSFRRNNKAVCVSTLKFIAHLLNQRVIHEILVLEILALLLDQGGENCVELAVAFLKETGSRLSEISSRSFHAVCDQLRHLLHECTLSKRVQQSVVVLFAVAKDNFTDFPPVVESLDLVEEEDQFTHLVTLDAQLDVQQNLNIFSCDPDYVSNEDKYGQIKQQLFGDEDDNSSSEGDSEDDEDADDSTTKTSTTTIIDNTETNLVALRRTIYLALKSSLSFEESAHKLLKMKRLEGQEDELCHMILDCCAQERTYEKYFGLLAERFCLLNRKYQEKFEQLFTDTYDTCHRLDSVRMRNVCRMFAHLLHTDAISWAVWHGVQLTEDTTNSSTRVFIKIVFQELAEYMGLVALDKRLQDPSYLNTFDNLMPRDDPRNTRFSINFFTSIGLGELTCSLRNFLNASKTEKKKKKHST